MTRISIVVLALAATLAGSAGGLAIAQDSGEALPEYAKRGGGALNPVEEAPEDYDIFQDWMDSNHVLGEGDTECKMCVGFGGGFKCGVGCDSTGLTTVKPDGYRHHICGTCTAGDWIK